MVIEVKPLQPENASSPIMVTELPIVNTLSDVLFFIKASEVFRPKYRVVIGELGKLNPEIDVAPSAIISSVKPLQLLNAEEPIEVTELPIVNFLRDVCFFINTSEVFLPKYRVVIGELGKLNPEIGAVPSAINSSVKPVQPENALSQINVTELGMVIEVKPVQLRNAFAGIVFTLFPIFIVFRFEQPLNTGYDEDPIEVQFSALKLTSVKPVQS